MVVRLFDPRLSSNRFVMTAFLLTFGLVTVFATAWGEPVSAGASQGLHAALTVLLSWAMARELDPDSPRSAAVAAVLGFLVSLTGSAQLSAVTALLFAVRIVARSTGSPPSIFDCAWLPLLAAFSARTSIGLPAALALAVAMVLDTLLPRRAPMRVRFSGAVAGALAIYVAVSGDALRMQWEAPIPGQLIVLILVLCAVPSLRTPPPVSLEDLSGERVSHRRLTSARLLAVGTGLLTLLWLGGPGTAALVGLEAAVAAIAVDRWILTASRDRRRLGGEAFRSTGSGGTP
ncbi:hypothetical protein BH24ACT26_BH24ACT26_18380 [soil metagenome]